MVIRVGVVGAAGRMGATVCQAVAQTSDLELAAVVDPVCAGDTLAAHAGPGVPELVVAAELSALTDAGVDVVVDFTVLSAARSTALWCAENGIHDVIGTSGFSDLILDELRAAFDRSSCLVAPNFAIGAVLMTRFAEMAAPFFETAEIIELHHDRKLDAPSGTAAHTASRMAAASPQWASDPTTHLTLDGARGAAGPAGIRIHSVRLRGIVAHQEVLLGTTGQTLTIRHDSYDRWSFMPGVLLAVREIHKHRGLTLGLDAVMGL